MTAPPAAPEVVLDLSRLLSRVLHPTPTGVDRVEMAYARGLLDRLGPRLGFGALHPLLGYGRLSPSAVLRFLDRTERHWAGAAGPRPRRHVRRDALRTLVAVRPGRVPPARGPRVLIQASPHHLQHAERVAAILRRESARFACLLHDLIPIEFPEYARPNGLDLHLRRIDTVARLADGVIANSAATARAFRPYLAAAGRDVPVRVAHLGLAPVAGDVAPTGGAAPYFVCVSTIEPRKNHLLLLNVWRALRQSGAPAVPRLVLIGRRGWENENVVDMLERSPALRGYVDEHAGLGDREVQRLVAGAAALLLPSFAEGYGLPVGEALAAGTPVICSDLPALREVGEEVADYLDPLDGPGWTRAILDYATPGSLRRAAQLERLRRWRAPTWDDHVDSVLTLVEEIA